MRTLRLSLAGTVILALFAGLSGVVMAQDEDPMAPATFEWKITDKPADHYIVDLETFSQVTVGQPMEATDPRASGLLSWAKSTSAYEGTGRESGNTDLPMSSITDWSVRLVNDGGTWAGTGTTIRAVEPDERTKKQKKKGSGKRPLVVETLLWELKGEGDYEGLSMFLTANPKWWGFIVPTVTLPVAPELPPAAEPPAE